MINSSTHTLHIHLNVLQQEIKVLKDIYYNPNIEGTGRYNTAIGVLEERVEEIQKQIKKI